MKKITKKKLTNARHLCLRLCVWSQLFSNVFTETCGQMFWLLACDDRSLFVWAAMLWMILHGGMDDDDHHAASFLRSESMVKLHVGFELVSWALLINLGSIFGRYLKNPPDQAYDWYTIHMRTQLFGTLLSFLGSCVIYLHISSFHVSHFQGTHQILGVLLMVATVAQGILGYLAHRKFVTTNHTSIFHTIHRWIGRLILPLAFVVMFYGVKLYFEDFFAAADEILSRFVWICFFSIVLCTFITVLVFEAIKRNAMQEQAEPETECPKEDPDHSQLSLLPYSSFFRTRWPVWKHQIVFGISVGTTLFFVVPLLLVLVM